MLAPLRRKVRLARIRGFRRSLTTACESYLFAYRRLYLFYRVLPLSRAPDPSDEFRYRIVTLEDAHYLAAFEHYRRLAEFREWFREGAWIFLAMDGERPVAFQCLSRQTPTSPPFSSIKLAPNQVWSVDAYTASEYRRRHVGAGLKAFRNRWLVERGFQENVVIVREDNIPSLVFTYDAQAQRAVQRLTYLRLLWFSHTWWDEDARATLEGHLRQAGVTPRGAPS
jgi:hypothetical protein